MVSILYRYIKKDDVPGLFLSNKFFLDIDNMTTINNYNQIKYDELEVIICRNIKKKLL
jgi:hypothetical protein